jgi:hypothetical protein
MTDLRVLSLGAGVQSTTVALMIEAGEIPMVDCAIFADTMQEPSSVYTHLEWLKKQLSFPVYTTSIGDLKKDIINAVSGNKFLSIPLFTVNKQTGKKGLLRRQCTREYKISPVNQKVRELLGLKKGEKRKNGTEVEMLMGISLDEPSRMRTNIIKYIKNVYPLIEKRMSRQDCLDWMNKNNFPKPPRSACTFCPFHSDTEWLDIKQNKKEWDDVVELDYFIRNGTKQSSNEVFLHHSCKPIDQVDLSKEPDQLNMFENECSGGCGL